MFGNFWEIYVEHKNILVKLENYTQACNVAGSFT